jgi:hypothetical protein
MRFIRTLTQAAATAVTVAVVALVGAATASAQPAPIEPDRTPPSGTTSSGFDLWPIVPLVIVGVLLVVATGFAITAVVSSHRRHQHRPATA